MVIGPRCRGGRTTRTTCLARAFEVRIILMLDRYTEWAPAISQRREESIFEDVVVQAVLAGPLGADVIHHRNLWIKRGAFEIHLVVEDAVQRQGAGTHVDAPVELS